MGLLRNHGQADVVAMFDNNLGRMNKQDYVSRQRKRPSCIYYYYLVFTFSRLLHHTSGRPLAANTIAIRQPHQATNNTMTRIKNRKFFFHPSILIPEIKIIILGEQLHFRGGDIDYGTRVVVQSRSSRATTECRVALWPPNALAIARASQIGRTGLFCLHAKKIL